MVLEQAAPGTTPTCSRLSDHVHPPNKSILWRAVYNHPFVALYLHRHHHRTMSNDASAAASKAAGRVLLPDNIVPSRYELKIKPDLEAFTFDGECKIVLDTTSTVSGNQIKLHAKELCFSKANFVVQGSADETPVDCEEVSGLPCTLRVVRTMTRFEAWPAVDAFGTALCGRLFFECKVDVLILSTQSQEATLTLTTHTFRAVPGQCQNKRYDACLREGHSAQRVAPPHDQLQWIPEQSNGWFLP